MEVFFEYQSADDSWQVWFTDTPDDANSGYSSRGTINELTEEFYWSSEILELIDTNLIP